MLVASLHSVWSRERNNASPRSSAAMCNAELRSGTLVALLSDYALEGPSWRAEPIGKGAGIYRLPRWGVQSCDAREHAKTASRDASIDCAFSSPVLIRSRAPKQQFRRFGWRAIQMSFGQARSCDNWTEGPKPHLSAKSIPRIS